MTAYNGKSLNNQNMLPDSLRNRGCKPTTLFCNFRLMQTAPVDVIYSASKSIKSLNASNIVFHCDIHVPVVS
jgi:hypothetical protein